MWRRILVATGGSPWSDTAVTYATALAVDTGAEVCLLTVLNAPAVMHPLDCETSLADDLLSLTETEGKERLHRVAAYAAQAGVVSSTVIKWGSIPEAILRTATEESCDLIILGARQQLGWKRLQVGEITNAVAAKSRQPVMLVKQAELSPLNLPQWARLLVATGGSAWSDAAVSYALSLAQAYLLDVCFLYVGPTRSRRRGGDGVVAGESILARAQAQAEAMGVACETRHVTGHTSDVILQAVERQQCDAIVLGSRLLMGWKRLRVGLTANVVSAKSPVPVMLVKPNTS